MSCTIQGTNGNDIDYIPLPNHIPRVGEYYYDNNINKFYKVVTVAYVKKLNASSFCAIVVADTSQTYNKILYN